MAELAEAAKGLKTIKKLDEEAVELGLEPTYETEKLQWIINDIEVKYRYLQANRSKRSK